MAKFQFVLLALALIAVANSEPQRRLSARQRTRVLARQEAAVEEAAVTPYPSADELKPEVPFSDGGVVEEFPADEPQPDEVYGPPEVNENHLPDEVYGPPESEVPAVADAAAEEVPAPQLARLASARRAAALRQRRQRQSAAYRQAVAAQRSAKLRAAAKKRSA